MVVHPGAAVILPLLPEDRLVMIRNYRYAVEQRLWELPAGTMHADEAPAETARRELEEETGYRAGRIVAMEPFYSSPGICTERMHPFVAEELTRVGQALEDGEEIEVRVLTLVEAREKLVSGEFCDGKTIAVLARYFLQRRAEGAD